MKWRWVLTFEYYAKIYIQIKRTELKPASLEKYENILEKVVLPEFGNRSIDEIKPLDVRLWFSKYNHRSPKTKRDYLIVLRGVFNEAFFDEKITRNPVDYIKLPKLHKSRVQPFSKDEVESILRNASGWRRNYYAIAFFTGMRSGEIIALRWSDVDFIRRTIYVQRTRRKGIETTPKTQSSVRIIPIFSDLLPFLEDQYKKTGNKNSYVFLNGDKPYRDTNTCIDRSWKNLLNRLKIPYRRLYNTRHTFATLLLNSDKFTKNQISMLLGHTNNQMLFQIYAGFIESEKDKIDLDFSILK
ncbi:tyrosine-type recombinase/integrase [Hydrogenimonas sp.]